MNNDWTLSYEQNMAQLLNHMDAINKISPMINVERADATPNQCMYPTDLTPVNETWHQGYSFTKSTSSEMNEQPTIVVDEVQNHNSPQEESLEAFLNILDDDTFLPAESSLLTMNDHAEESQSITITTDIFDFAETELPQNAEPSTPSVFLNIEKPSRGHARRGSFSTVEEELLYVQPQHQPQERPRSPKRTRRNSFSDLEELEARGVEDELEGIKKCKFDEQFQSIIASKKKEQPPQLRIENEAGWDELNGEYDQQSHIQIKMQPVLMYGNVPVQVLDTRSLSPMLPDQMGQGFALSPNGDQMFMPSPQSPGDMFAFGPPFQFGGGPPPQKKMVPVKRRNSKPSPADRYMSQFLMKQNR